jgi:hypothetical protein
MPLGRRINSSAVSEHAHLAILVCVHDEQHSLVGAEVVRTPGDSLQKSKNLEKRQNSPLSPFPEAEIPMTKASFCCRVCE